MRWLDGITDSVDMSLQTLGDSEGQGSLGILQSMRLQRVGHNLVNEQQQQRLFQCSVRPACFGMVCFVIWPSRFDGHVSTVTLPGQIPYCVGFLACEPGI